jgi:elongation factor P
MIRGGEIAIGTCLIFNGQPHIVVERESLGQGREASFVRVSARSLKAGGVVTQLFRGDELVEDAALELQDCQYQYEDGENYMFMNGHSLEQFAVHVGVHEERGPYLREGETYSIVMWKGEAVDIRIEARMVFTVALCEERMRSDAIAGGTKSVTTETGLVVRVPLFISQGERIVVDTASNEYIGRFDG